MEGDKSKPSSLPEDSQNKHFARLAENVEGFRQFFDEIFKAIEDDESFYEMTAEGYDQKKSYVKAHLLELAFMHNMLAGQYADLIEQVSKNCPLEENVKGFGQFFDELFKAIEDDESFSEMTAEGYDQKKSYVKAHLRELSFMHNSLASQYADLIEQVSKKCPFLTQKQHLGSSDSSSSSQVIDQMLAPKVTSGFDAFCHPVGGGLCPSGLESPMPSVYKPPIQSVSDDALKVKETKDPGCSGLESSMPSVYKAPVPPVNDDTLKVKETKDPGCSGSESSISSMNNPPLPPFNDDVLNVNETNDPGCSGSESSMSSVNKPLVPLVHDDASNVKETKDPGRSGSESFKSTVNKPPVPLVNNDALKPKNTSRAREQELKEQVSIAKLKVAELERSNFAREREANYKLLDVIKSHRSKVQDWNEEASVFKREAADREKRIKVLEKKLEEKCDLVDELKKEMKMKDKQVNMLEKKLKEQCQLLDEKKKETEMKDGQLNKMKSAGLEKEVEEEKRSTCSIC